MGWFMEKQVKTAIGIAVLFFVGYLVGILIGYGVADVLGALDLLKAG